MKDDTHFFFLFFVALCRVDLMALITCRGFCHRAPAPESREEGGKKQRVSVWGGGGGGFFVCIHFQERVREEA